jgi:hypothetical protein
MSDATVSLHLKAFTSRISGKMGGPQQQPSYTVIYIIIQGNHGKPLWSCGPPFLLNRRMPGGSWNNFGSKGQLDVAGVVLNTHKMDLSKTLLKYWLVFLK